MMYQCLVTCPLGPSLAEMCDTSQFIVFMTLVNELSRSENIISEKCERIKPIKVPDEEYDFVMIGGRGAGAVVAGRLSENPKSKVLVLEAGYDEPAGSQIPIFSAIRKLTEVTQHKRKLRLSRGQRYLRNISKWIHPFFDLNCGGSILSVSYFRLHCSTGDDDWRTSRRLHLERFSLLF